MAEDEKGHKFVVYQMMTRLFGNTNTTNVPWGTLKENGVGKFNDINDKALQGIKDLGATHVWYTGVIEHAVITDYTKFDIPLDDADVVKGRAGSPYAIKDYYDVNPDMAVEVPNRMKEFESLIQRTHDNGLKVLIDFVPNHVARDYHSDVKPEGVEDFGATDNTTVGFDPQNNFYYIAGEDFKVPSNYKPLGGKPFPTADGKFKESPAKVSGNGAVTAQPSEHDWFETVRLNYGVNHLENASKHFDPVPSTWKKTLEILTYWTNKGVDGFRCDMAEMVPVEFWGWMIPQIQKINPDIIFIAEIYNPNAYRDYIHEGKFDYLYDKVGMYDSLRAVMSHRDGSTAEHFTQVWKGMEDINNHMLRFLENHDEQRIASPDFAGTAKAGIPGMTVSATLGTGPVMIYFGQEVGEPGKGASGFSNDDGRTTIFDYWGVPEHQKWVNGHQYDGGQLSEEQKELRAFYTQLMKVTMEEKALQDGELIDLQPINLDNPSYDTKYVYSYIRLHDKEEAVLVVTNFSDEAKEAHIVIPDDIQKTMKKKDASTIQDLLGNTQLGIDLEEASTKGIKMEIPAYGAYIFKLY
ncbi:alpha-amylase family protein [Algivirga pacifica]|uniref:Alpha-amylase family protein n=2 Tax=Algivirga pacifica TaxID=1162670 RepID=A0ABP9DMQ9_9BACT